MIEMLHQLLRNHPKINYLFWTREPPAFPAFSGLKRSYLATVPYRAISITPMQIIAIPRSARFDIFSPSKPWEITAVQI